MNGRRPAEGFGNGTTPGIHSEAQRGLQESLYVVKRGPPAAPAMTPSRTASPLWAFRPTGRMPANRQLHDLKSVVGNRDRDYGAVRVGPGDSDLNSDP